MATGSDPLRRSAIDTIAREPRSQITASSTNAALQAAQALSGIAPVTRQLMGQLAEEKQKKEEAKAKRDALIANGAAYADAVREGKLRKTQNPWYIQAYNRERAAIVGQRSLQQLQIDSASWDEIDDPQAFEKRWREEVGEVASQFEDEDSIAGFLSAEGQVSSQVLQINVAKNVKRIETERVANLGGLSAEALSVAVRENGGTLTPNQAWQALLPARQQWFATGGDELGWAEIVRESLGAAAREQDDDSLLSLYSAPELRYGPSLAGDGQSLGTVGESSPEYTGPRTIELPPSQPVAVGETPQRSVRVTAPARKGFDLKDPLGGKFAAGSGYGRRKRPIAGASTNHLAVDYPAPAGTPVQSVATGKVVFAGKKGGYGNRVEVDYGNGVISSYSHLSSIAVKPGQLISAGTSVGGVGRTGTATGNHLHWEVTVNGNKVDPRKFAASIGGDFEGAATREPPAPESFAGFPEGTADQPFTAAKPNSELPPDHTGVGPSYYDMPGMSAQVEQDRYYIRQQAEGKAGARLRLLTAQRAARGQEAVDSLYVKHGTGLLMGNVSRETIISELSKGDYSGPEISAALNILNSTLRDSAGVADAQVAARAADPGVAQTILDLKVEGIQNGYSPEYRDKVGAGILGGWLSRSDGESLLGGALAGTERLESEARQEQADARTEARIAKQEAAGGLDKYSELRDLAKGYASLFFQTARKLGRTEYEDPDRQNGILRRITDAMQAHLARNPGDWEGANAVGRKVAAAGVQSLTASATGVTPAPAKPSTSAAPSGSNANPLRK